MSNKIKYDLKNVHYAKHIIGEDGGIEFDTPIPIPGAVSVSLGANGEISQFYADGVVYYEAEANNGYEGELENAMFPESFSTDILGDKEDSNGVLVENSNAKKSRFALLFEFAGDVKAIRHVLYNCGASRISIESKTKEKSIEPVTEKVTISAIPLPDGKVKTKTGDKTDETVYENWYKSVYIPDETGSEEV